MKTTHVLTIALVFILGIFLWSYPFPKQIDKEIPAMMSITENGSEEAYTHTPTTIHVKGEIYQKLFRSPEFNVKITVDGFEWMDDYPAGVPTIGDSKEGIYVGAVWYNNFKSNIALEDQNKVAFVWFDKEFERMNMEASIEEWMDEEEGQGRTLYITGRADSAEQAEAIREGIRDLLYNEAE
ncbi:hypothetical protein [Saccharibacillus kuerlensis]|uniref:Uncharacterized protein n=1 Tax=Saccharibacillus kuerlensis TaxID=459527 RepID=A0ABQ2L2V8_9BACL|nr:hypothetical protein [Saccharibacillus kuerlensis]GGO00434.1 hypothetical protein GCM10010969_21640 [Saccharibacillus kuerlensis]